MKETFGIKVTIPLFYQIMLKDADFFFSATVNYYEIFS